MGEPVSLDGKKLDPRPLVEELNKLGGAYGVGIADIVGGQTCRYEVKRRL